MVRMKMESESTDPPISDSGPAVFNRRLMIGLSIYNQMARRHSSVGYQRPDQYVKAKLQFEKMSDPYP